MALHGRGAPAPPLPRDARRDDPYTLVKVLRRAFHGCQCLSRHFAAFDARRAGADLIMVSHSMGAIARYCDRGALLVDGRLIMYPTADGVAAA